MPEEKPKKNIWDFLDRFLPSATSVYTQIRTGRDGRDPFAQPDEDGKLPSNLQPPPPTPQKRGNVILWIGGLAAVGVGTYFLIKKYKKS